MPVHRKLNSAASVAEMVLSEPVIVVGDCYSVAGWQSLWDLVRQNYTPLLPLDCHPGLLVKAEPGLGKDLRQSSLRC